ncbi:hypothetical protein G6M26_10670 [Agrobacterium tumefaciens]|nr:hypothetical protein [Agrobacterium tumefaciens]NTE18983.1 hypothetical protein [Agrobacterium tumefaciens]
MEKVNKSQPIDKDIAQKMVNAYSEEAARLNSKSYTKAVWFPAEQILAMAKKISEGKHDGLRIYFAKYLSESLEGLSEDHLGRNTVLLVPTYAAGETNTRGEVTKAHEDDIDDIENRGELCPTMCDGVEL